MDLGYCLCFLMDLNHNVDNDTEVTLVYNKDHPIGYEPLNALSFRIPGRRAIHSTKYQYTLNVIVFEWQAGICVHININQ